MTKLERRDDSISKRTSLAVIGEQGAIHYWHECLSESLAAVFGKRRFGGVEMHKKTPFEHSNEKPDHDNCWLLGCPCWHDGFSLYASEVAIPKWEACQDAGDMEPFWLWLEQEYYMRFEHDQT